MADIKSMGCCYTLPETNISTKNGTFEDDFPNFPRWDMLVPWRVTPIDGRKFPWGFFGEKQIHPEFPNGVMGRTWARCSARCPQGLCHFPEGVGFTS